MNNLNELLSIEYWMQYLELATEGGLTDGAIANDIVAGIEKAINYSRCCKSDSEQLFDKCRKNDALDFLSKQAQDLNMGYED